MLKLTLLICFNLIFFTSSFFAQPKIPFWDVNSTPCEGCLYGEWKVKRETKLYQAPYRDSQVGFVVKKGETLTAETGVVITRKLGIGKAVKDTFFDEIDEKGLDKRRTEIKIDERFYILSYTGEGFYKVWFRGRIFHRQLFDDELRIVRRPEAVWWVLIETLTRFGWTKQTANFSGPKEF